MKTILAVATLLVFLVPSGSKSTQEPAPMTEDAAIVTVIRSYVSVSLSGKFKNLADLTTDIPQFAIRHDKVEKPVGPVEANKILVAPRQGTTNRFDKIRGALPKEIFGERQRILDIQEVIRRNNLAKVPVFYGNDEMHVLLPWVFMLVQTKDGSWKIYDVTTPAYSQDYFP
jgi:hypothetical protein